jgi:hypothetical protein
MRRLLIIIMLIVFFLPISAFCVEQIVPYGYSYFTLPEGVGTVATVVGFLDPPSGFDYPFSVDFTNNEYTFYFQSTITGMVPGPVTTEIFYANTTFTIYEDPAKNGDYGTSPPNGTSPSTFQDGTIILTGEFIDIVRLDYNFGFPEPTVMGIINFTGGTKLGEMTEGGDNWIFHAGLSSMIPGIPVGYQKNWSCKIIKGTVPTEHTTWGDIKSIFALELE